MPYKITLTRSLVAGENSLVYKNYLYFGEQESIQAVMVQFLAKPRSQEDDHALTLCVVPFDDDNGLIYQRMLYVGNDLFQQEPNEPEKKDE